MTKNSHLGAKDCVTCSCHLIETRLGSADSINILVDCGTAYGDDPELPSTQFPVPPDKINYLPLTHATKELLLPIFRHGTTFSDKRDQKEQDKREQNDFRDQRGLNFIRSSSRKLFCPRNEAHVDGQFKVNLEYTDNRKLSGSGPIHFLLTENGGRLLVKEMDYVFRTE